MEPRRPRRKHAAVVTSLLLAAAFIWFASTVLLMSGTKANMTFQFVGTGTGPRTTPTRP